MSPKAVACFSKIGNWLHRARWFLAIFFIVATGVAVLLLVRSQGEPAYQKRSASEWLEVVRTNQAAMAEVAQAFKKMGPEGALYLGEQLERKPSKIYSWALTHHQSIPLSVRKLILKSEWHYRGDAIIALLDYMGTNATPAVPAVINWLEHQPPVPVQYQTPYPPALMYPGYVVRTVRTTTGTYKTNIAISFLLTNQPGGFQTAVSPVSPPKPATSTNFTTRTQMVVSAPGIVTTNVVSTLNQGIRPLSRNAFQVLVNCGGDDPRIISLLLNPQNDVSLYRRSAKYQTNLKLAVTASIPYIIQQADTPVLERKLAAMSLLQLALPESSVVREYMIRSLRSREVSVFDLAIRSLQTTTNDLEQLIPLAVAGLFQFQNRTTDLDGDWIPPVYLALKTFSQQSPLVIPQLQTAILQVEPYEQVGILQLLRQIGSRDTVDMALIASFTTNRIGMVRSAAWMTLGKLKGDPLAEALSEITFQDYGPHKVPEAAYAKVDALKADAVIAVPTLIYCLKNEHIGTLLRTIEALGSIGPAAREAVEPLRSLRNHPEEEVREKVAVSLRLIEAK